MTNDKKNNKNLVNCNESQIDDIKTLLKKIKPSNDKNKDTKKSKKD